MVLAVVIGIGYYSYDRYRAAMDRNNMQFAAGNGRLEATEVSVSSKLAGRIENILVDEGDFVTQGQTLAIMQTDVLNAQLAQAQARLKQAQASETSAQTLIQVRISERDAMNATVAQKQSNLDGAQKRFKRAQTLSKAQAMSQQTRDDDETAYLVASAILTETKTKVKQADVMIEMAKADAIGAAANVKAAEADIALIQADLKDCILVAPRDGRIQYRIAQPGEVLAAGGRVLNLVDLTDVYMTFFLPEETAGKIITGAEVRLVLDALPDTPIPASISYVASVAQFTPKTVETQASGKN